MSRKIAADGRGRPLDDRAANDWRGELRRSIGWLLLFKLLALIVLWSLFFSPSHRPDMDGGRVSKQLAVTATPEPYPEPRDD